MKCLRHALLGLLVLLSLSVAYASPSIVSPTPSTVLSNSSVQLSWQSNGADVASWRVFAGSSPQGHDYFNSGELPGDRLTHMLHQLPADGRALHITLWYRLQNTTPFLPVSVEYVAAGGGAPAILAPSLGPALASNSEMFSWHPHGVIVEQWSVSAGSQPRGYDYYQSGRQEGTFTSTTMSHLPTDGRPIFVTLRYRVKDASSYSVLDYVYSSAGGPSLTDPTAQTSDTSETVSLTIGASDPAGGPLSFAAAQLPPGLVIDNTTGTISGSPTADGNYYSSVSVTSPSGGMSEVQFSWSVVTTNNAPQLTDPSDRETSIGLAMDAWSLVATDPDADPLTFSATNLPDGVLLAAQTGEFTGTPITLSSPVVSVSVDDGRGGFDTEAFTWLISDDNQAPTVVGPGLQQAVVGDVITLPIAASDADNDPLTFSADSLPTALTLDSTLGIITGTVTTAASSSTTVMVSDGIDPAVAVPFDWTIIGNNQNPTFTEPATHTTIEQGAVSFQLEASDPDNQPLSFTVGNLPAGLVASTAGLITGQPTTIETRTVDVMVDDGYGGTDAGSFDWTVAQNTPPTITMPARVYHEEEQPVSIQIVASDPDSQALTYSITDLPTELSIDPLTGLVTGTVTDPGQHNVTVTVDDGHLGVTNVALEWLVEPKGVPAYVPPSAPVPTSPYLWEVTASGSAGATVDLSHRIRQGYNYNELFGFNLNWYAFQYQLLSQGTIVSPNIVTDTQTWFAGSRQRFPGGNVSTSWTWDETLGPVEGRTAHEIFYGGHLLTPEFGLDEYIDFSNQISAHPVYYALNLTGLTPSDIDQLATPAELATSNGGLADYLNQNLPSTYPHYQLGNELNRARFAFTHQELIDRSQASIDAIRAEQPDARFVNFLRDFTMGGVTWQTQMTDLYDGLPQVHDHTLFAYYDPIQSPHYNQPSSSVIYWMPYYLQKLQDQIDYFESTVRPGKTARIWISEHARRRLTVNNSNPPPGGDATPKFVSNLAGSLSTADYLIAIMQIPQVMGAMYHGSPGGPWRLFDDAVNDNDYQPLTSFWTMAMLKDNTLADIVATENVSTNVSNYPGGYDTRAVAFYDATADAMKLWVINRHDQNTPFLLTVPQWNDKTVSIDLSSISGGAGVDIDDPDYEGIVNLPPVSLGAADFSATGVLSLTLPPSSISVYTLQ